MNTFHYMQNIFSTFNYTNSNTNKLNELSAGGSSDTKITSLHTRGKVHQVKFIASQKFRIKKITSVLALKLRISNEGAKV